jgi:hypothetical protein
MHLSPRVGMCVYDLFASAMQRISPLIPISRTSVLKCADHMSRVGHNRIYTPYMTVYLVISLPAIPSTIPDIHCVYISGSCQSCTRCNSHLYGHRLLTFRPFNLYVVYPLQNSVREYLNTFSNIQIHGHCKLPSTSYTNLFA